MGITCLVQIHLHDCQDAIIQTRQRRIPSQLLLRTFRAVSNINGRMPPSDSISSSRDDSLSLCRHLFQAFSRDLKILDASAFKNAVTSERALIVTATFAWEKETLRFALCKRWPKQVITTNRFSQRIRRFRCYDVVWEDPRAFSRSLFGRHYFWRRIRAPLDCSFSKNLELPYEEYERFDLEEMADSECRAVLTCHRSVSHDKNQGEIRNKAILCARKFPQIYLFFGFLSEDLTLTFPSISSLKLNYKNTIWPNSSGISFSIIMFTNFGQNMLF